MDKRAKKRIKALKGKLDKLRQQLAGAREQADDPGEVGRREAEIAAVQEQLKALRAS